MRKEKDGFRVDGSEERPTESLRRLVLNNSVVSVCSRTSLDSRAARARGACGCERPAGDRRKQNETPQFEVCGVVSRVLNIASCVCDVEDARLVRYAAIVPRHPSGRRTTPASRPTTRTPTKNPDKDRKGGGLFLFTHFTVERCPFLFIYLLRNTYVVITCLVCSVRDLPVPPAAHTRAHSTRIASQARRGNRTQAQ